MKGKRKHKETRTRHRGTVREDDRTAGMNKKLKGERENGEKFKKEEETT